MRLNLTLLIAAGALAASALPLTAHHSFAAEYDGTKLVRITGNVSKVEWMNPHIYYYLNVKSEDGKVTNYSIEGGTPGSLYRQSWRKDSLRVGDVINGGRIPG